MTQTLEERKIEGFERPLISNISKGILQSKLELSLFCILVIFASAIAVFKFEEVSRVFSLEWDSASFLTNAGVYAGFNQYQQALDPTRPPVIPFALSLIFRITGPLVTDGYILSSLFYFLSIIGCFLIAKEMMNPILAGLASLSFGLAPYVFQWSGIMLSDTEGVAVASLALATLIIATKRNKKLLLISLPLLILTPLTRYSLGLIILVAIVYLISARKNDWIFDHYEFYYGFGLSLVAFLIFGGQWISYPFVHRTTVSVLFPKPDAVNPFHSVLGPWFYAFNFPHELGLGFYGDLLAFLFGISAIYIALKLSRRSLQKVSPVAVALLAWFLLMFAYYSFGWPYADLRYSIEFVMPAIILAYYSLSLILARFESSIRRGVNGKLPIFFSILVLAVVFGAMVFAFYQSGYSVATNTQPMEAGLNGGVKLAVTWLQAHVPTSYKIESNWYTLMWWYAPFYNTTAAPLDYQLTNLVSYQSWQSNLVSNKIAYVVYVDPSQQLMQGMLILTSVFNSTSSSAEVVVFRVS